MANTGRQIREVEIRPIEEEPMPEPVREPVPEKEPVEEPERVPA